MSMLELPTNIQDIVSLADWLEISALNAGDKNASAGDLQNALQLVADHQTAETLTLSTFLELEDRRSAAADSYPFIIDQGRVLQTQSDPNKYVAYIFCLLLSHFGWKNQKNIAVNPWLLFEDLSCIAAKHYVQGEVYQFGTSRRENGLASFHDAINELCVRLGEGAGIRTVKTLNKKDDHVDLVAWKGFADRRESKLILFGQCASGAKWEDKVSELQPNAFWNHWMQESETSQLCRSFFVPHCIAYQDGEKWRYLARYGGILFDRCRIAYWSKTDTSAIIEDGRYSQWCNEILPVL